jgi:hypothetical protein
MTFDFNVDPDPALHSNADPDPAFKNKADPKPCRCQGHLRQTVRGIETTQSRRCQPHNRNMTLPNTVFGTRVTVLSASHDFFTYGKHS